jgi:hypothetical protein
VEEVDKAVYYYLSQEVSKEDTEKSLSQFYFTKSQAREITEYFLNYKPADLYDVESGLNSLGLRNSRELNVYNSLIHIKNSSEKINVRYPVEVFGSSEVAAFGYARVTSHDKSSVTAFDCANVEALDYSRVTAFDQSFITARNNSLVYLHNQSTAMAFNHAFVNAADHAKVTLLDEANAGVFDNAAADAHNHAHVTCENKAVITASDDATVHAFDTAHVTAKSRSYVDARKSVTVHAEDDAVVAAGGNARVIAKHNTLVFTRGDAVCENEGKARVITGTQNKPCFLRRNVLHILDHPYFKKEPVIALRLLLNNASQEDRPAFSRKLTEMGCTDSQSTVKVFTSLAREIDRGIDKKREARDTWER